jgi:predicted phage terminase large subunit-like protein
VKTEIKAALQDDFSTFVALAHRKQHGEKLEDVPYVPYLALHVTRLAKGITKRLAINLPPGHLKTFFGICLAAWILAHRPTAKIMIVTYGEQLASDIAYQIRAILQSEWFKKVFATRVADNRAQLLDFRTTAGGGVFAASIDGAITGRRANYVIIDDPLAIKDAGNIDQIERVNRRFDTVIQSRLNNPKIDRILLIQHRLHENDLSGYVRKRPGWKAIVLPMVAPRSRTYDLGYDKWHRKKGDLLRPKAFSKSNVRDLMNSMINPDFATLYQQDPGGQMSLRIKSEHFGMIEADALYDRPVVLSVDPGQAGGQSNSFSVIQVWSLLENGCHCLLDQWREQTDYNTLRSNLLRLARRHRPSATLVENTALGVALISDLRRKRWLHVTEIIPDGRSKMQRLCEHAKLIRKGKIQIIKNAPFRPEFIAEITQFPSAQFDDQVDAMTQYLSWIAKNPNLEKRPPPALGGVALASKWRR